MAKSFDFSAKSLSLADRIRAAREAREWSQRRLSDEAGLNESAIKDIESGKSRNPRQDTLRKIATALGWSPADLLSDDAPLPPPRPSRPAPSPVARIPEVDVRGGMGGGGIMALEINYTDEWGNQVACDDVRGYWEMPEDYVRHEIGVPPSRVRIFEVAGDSMIPTLYSRDKVMAYIDDTDPAQGGVFAVWDGDAVIVKRVEKIYKSDPPAIRVISDNPAHQPFTLVLGDGGAHIIGRVKWKAQRM